jgi:hypothetical protein
LFRRKRRGKVLDVVSTAIPGGAAAWNVELTSGGLIAKASLKAQKMVNCEFIKNTPALAV